MKQYLLNPLKPLETIWNLIKRGIIRIFPTPEEAINAIIRFQLFLILITILLVCCSCSSTKMVTQTVRDVSKDTIYLSNVQYDSIYIYHDRVSEHHIGTLPPILSDGSYLNVPTRTDTLYIKDKSIEYRYKLLKDTIRVVERDSIPYEVTIVQTKEITRPLTWYDHLTRLSFWFLIGSLITFIIIKLKRVF